MPAPAPTRLCRRIIHSNLDLAHWSAARRKSARVAPAEVGLGSLALTLDHLIEIAQLSDAQLDAESMAEGARVCWGLAEWDLSRRRNSRSHFRYLAQLTA